jgi:alkyl hydroperoxide reductase subunit AhpC
LQAAREEFQKQGLGVAAISYDTEPILQDFAKRHDVQFPLLADPKSQIIRAYGVLNPKAEGFTRGMAFPGYFFIGPNGMVKEKFFETAYTDRDTANNLLLKIFPQLVQGSGREVPAPFMKVTLRQSDKVVVPGSRFTLVVDVDLPRDTHVYAPGVKGYKPIQLAVDESPDFRLQNVLYPDPKVLYLPAIQESVPVFEGRFRISQDVMVSADRAFSSSLGTGKAASLHGTLFYQACDQTKCYMPQKTNVSWRVQINPLDGERVPEAIQHK